MEQISDSHQIEVQNLGIVYLLTEQPRTVLDLTKQLDTTGVPRAFSGAEN